MLQGVCEIFLKSDSEVCCLGNLSFMNNLSVACHCSFVAIYPYTASFIPLKPCHYSKTKFMSHVLNSLCHFNNLQSIFTRRSFQLKKPLCLLIHKNYLFLQVLSCNCSNSITSLCSTSDSIYLFLFPPQL